MINLYTSAHAAVDAIQGTKKQYVNIFVKHQKLNLTLNKFVDEQTKYTKSAIDLGIQTMFSVSTTVASSTFFNELIDSFKLHITEA